MKKEEHCDLNILRKTMELSSALNASGFLRSLVGPRTWAIKRFRDLALRDDRIQLILYWGAFVPRSAGREEVELVDLVEKLRVLISEFLLSLTEIMVIFTDTHTTINGVSEEISHQYFDECKNLFPLDHWHTCFMTKLLIDTNTTILPLQTNDYKLLFRRQWELLVRQSSAIHRDSNTALEAAEKYLQSNLFESSAVLKKFPQALLLNTGIPEMTFYLPTIPILHIFLASNGRVHKPWFTKSIEVDS